ncbi:hypothetical protein SPRG_16956, partial [Saprolegnia parasitica CBS 223.65]
MQRLLLTLLTLPAVVSSLGLQGGTCAANCTSSKQVVYCALSNSTTAYDVSFSNQCECLAAKCKNRKIHCFASAAKTCDPTCLSKLAKCKPNQVAPVCGSNGATYDHLCYLKAARCLNPSIEFLSPGKCPSTMGKCGLGKCSKTKGKEKVCATLKGATIKFKNECLLTAATCVNAAVTPVDCPKTKPATNSTGSGATFSVDEADDPELADDIGLLEVPVDTSENNFDLFISDDVMTME